jgi:predicted O-methyltransferase YrrM
MSAKTLPMTDELHRYLVEETLRETDGMRQLRTETATLEMARMQISPEQGQFMRWLVETLGVTRAIEVGVFTGYSALCVAIAMPEDGRLIACDISEEWTAIARKHWAAQGVAHKIELRLRPAIETLDELLESGYAGRFDFAFMDADKSSYDAYYERFLRLLRSGGVIAIDNALWSGKVADATVTDADTVALRALNQKVRMDARVTPSLVPIGDGLLLARKREMR